VWNALRQVDAFDRGLPALAGQVGASEFELGAALRILEQAGKVERGGRGEGAWTLTVTEEAEQVVSGLTGLVLLNSTASEFHGFPRDRYTTLAETTDRILATAVDARWRHLDAGSDWGKSFAAALEALTKAFVDTYSHSLQQTLYAMGAHVLSARPEIAEIRLALPNKHHYLVDLSPFELRNDNEVFLAGDRPYGLIEGTVSRDDAPPALTEWYL